MLAASVATWTGCGVAPAPAASSGTGSLAQLATAMAAETGENGSPEEARFAAFQSTETDVEGTFLQARGPQPDVMQVKLQQALQTLTDPNHEEQTHLQAVDQVMEVLFMSNLVVLPTANVPETLPPVQQHEQAILDAINGLTAHINPPGPGGPASKEAAWEARNFLQVFSEAAAVIGEVTNTCDPEDIRGPGCVLLLADDEGGTDVDGIFPGFNRAIRSPFFLGETDSTIQEQVIVPDAIPLDACVVVVKEIQGVKAVVRKVLIPIWVEPWYARAAIVGYKTVWVWEWVPAEFIKSISYCNNGGSLVQDVEIVTILERELMHFWSFLTKEISLTP
jgi:hypothetical protein